MNISSKKQRIVILHSKPWCEELFAFGALMFPSEKYDLICIRSESEFEANKDFKSTDILLFIHWNWFVSKEITQNYKCICFHMTDLPYGRGGSPLQNLLIRGATSTQVSAIKMTQELDSGPIYLKRELKLSGTALAIYLRAGQLSLIMAKDIVSCDLKPSPQEGKIVEFKRLSHADNLIEQSKSGLEYFANMVRMLDAPTYPNAYILFGDLKIHFHNIIEKDGQLSGEYTVEFNSDEN